MTRILLVETCSVPRRPTDPLAAEHKIRHALALESLVEEAMGAGHRSSRDLRGGELSLFGIPLGAAFLAGALRERGVEVLHEPLILDAVAGRDPAASLAAAVERDRPDAVGITVNHTIEQRVALDFAGAVKNVLPSARTILGGAHATFAARDLAADPRVDAVVRFEGEESLPACLDWLAGRRDARDVPSLTARAGGLVVENPAGPPAPFERAVPGYEAVHAERYAAAGIFAHVQTARGCPYACHFCCHTAFWGRKVRYRDAGLVAEEIRRLGDMGCDLFYLTDSTFTLDRRRVGAICEAIVAHGADDLVLAVETRVDKLDDEMLAWLARAGVRVVALGIETASPEVLAFLPDKRSDDPAGAAREAVRRIGSHGMHAYASLGLGFPGETAGSLDATVRLVDDLYSDTDGLLWADAKLARAFPGTELARNPARFHATVDTRYDLYDFFGEVTVRLDGGAAPGEVMTARRRIMERNIAAWRARRPQDGVRVAAMVREWIG